MTTSVHVLPTSAPDDTSGLESLFEEGSLRPENVVCVLGKTEGNGCVNDFSRGLATMAYERVLGEYLSVSPDAVSEDVMIMMSGGTEGVMTPHVTVFARRPSSGGNTSERRLTAGTTQTRMFDPEEIGRETQIQATATGVNAAIDDAGIADPSDVRFVQIKCPLLTTTGVADARKRDETVAVTDTYESMAYSRAASALGVGLATGELSPEEVSDGVVCRNRGVYSSVASTSAGSELDRSEILVLGNSKSASGEFVIGSSVMDDSLDVAAIEAAVSNAGVDPGSPADAIKNVFAKAEVTSSGVIRGRRHVVQEDSVISATRHARAVVGAVVGSTISDPLCYVSGGSEHQGPDGGGVVAAIAERN